jgi:phosphoglycerate dehydrogenase-like enzyme
MIGRGVIELLRPFGLKVLVYDPFLPPETAAKLGVTPVSLEQAFAQADVVSNHVANLPTTVGMLTGAHFRSMRPNATFINTGRGKTVREEEMAQVLGERQDLTALLDVVHPEPPRDENPLFRLPNVFFSPHIAGSLGHEVVRLADYALASFDAWRNGAAIPHNVSLEMLETMA